MTARAVSVLADPESLPLLPEAALGGFGPTLVVAPHPDDETLGSGGLIALLRARSLPVRVLVLTDGTGSHPNSRAYPAPRLRDLREGEALAALGHLGVGPGEVVFLREPDRRLALPGEPRHGELVERCRAELDAHAIGTVVVPWRRDPHPDHRAAWHLVSAAAAGAATRPRVLEVPLWLWVAATPDDVPRPGEATAWRLDVASVLARKRTAVAAHRSQVTDLIDDEPGGARITPAMLAYFDRTCEVYLEGRP